MAGPSGQPLTSPEAAPKDLKPEEAWAEEVGDKQSVSHALAFGRIARKHSQATSSSDAKAAVEGWKDDRLKPLGYAGIALGTKER